MGAAKKIQLAPDEIYIQEALKDGRATIQEVSLKALGRPDVAFQARVKHIDMDHVHRLTLIHDQEGRLSPIVAFHAVEGAKQRWIVADGFHRHEVYRRKGERAIRAYVVDVPMDSIEHEARLFAAMCNQVTLLDRTPQDVRRAVEMLFADPVCWEWSSRRIADHCGCAAHTVRNYRNEYASRNLIGVPDRLVSGDGKVRPAHNSRTTGKPVVSQTGSGFRAAFKGKRFFGRTREIVEAKVVVATNESGSGRISLTQNSELCRWVLRRGILAESVVHHTGEGGSLSCIKTPSAILVPVESLATESTCAAIGKLRLLRRHTGKLDARLVVVCYHDDQWPTLLDLARQDGVEFLTPEELVESLKGDSSPPPTPAPA